MAYACLVQSKHHAGAGMGQGGQSDVQQIEGTSLQIREAGNQRPGRQWSGHWQWGLAWLPGGGAPE